MAKVALRCSACSYITDAQFLVPSLAACPSCGDSSTPKNVITNAPDRWPASMPDVPKVQPKPVEKPAPDPVAPVAPVAHTVTATEAPTPGVVTTTEPEKKRATRR